MGTTQTQTLDEVLAHYGILGMRWGVRRTDAQLARARGERKKKGKPVTDTKVAKERAQKYSPDAERTKESLKKAKKGGTKALSNQELKDLNERLNLEQNYNRLTTKKEGKGKIKSGKKFVDEVVAMGETANKAYKLVNSPLVTDVRTVIDGKPRKQPKGSTPTVTNQPTLPGIVITEPKKKRRR